jgi:hypothetical protein
MSECTCGKPTRDDAFSCDECGDKTARALGDVPWLIEELEITITKQRAAIDGDGAASAETPLMYHLPAAEKRDALRHALVVAVRFCVEEGVRNSDPGLAWPDDDLASMSRWMLWRVDGLALNDMGEEITRAIRDTVRACRHVIDKPPERAYAGPCPECKRDLYHRHNAAEVRCHGCGQRWDVGEVNKWMSERITEHMRDKLVTAQEGAALLGRLGIATPVRSVYHWAVQGRIQVAGVNQKGHRLYRWNEVLPLAASKVAS